MQMNCGTVDVDQLPAYFSGHFMVSVVKKTRYSEGRRVSLSSCAPHPMMTACILVMSTGALLLRAASKPLLLDNDLIDVDESTT